VCSRVVVISLSRVCQTQTQTPPPNLAVRGRVMVSIRQGMISPNAVVNSSTSHNIMQGLQSAGKLLLPPAMVAPCEPCPKRDTSSKHSYTWSHCTSRVEQLRGRCRLSNLKI
jgi:hypothetical protein